MEFLAVPPKESITPRRKQRFYDFALTVYDRAMELQSDLQSAADRSEEDLINEELAILETLNKFQVGEIETF